MLLSQPAIASVKSPTDASTLQIQYSYFYSNAMQKIFQLTLRKGLRIAKTKMPWNIVDEFVT